MDEIFSLYTLIRGLNETSERFEISKESLGKILHPPGSFLRNFFSRVLECVQEMILASSIEDASEYFSLPREFLQVLFDPIAEIEYIENTRSMIESLNMSLSSNTNNFGSLNSEINPNPPLGTPLDPDLLLLASYKRNDYLLENNMVFRSSLITPQVGKATQIPLPSSLPHSRSLSPQIPVPDSLPTLVPAPHSINTPEPSSLPAPEPAPHFSVNRGVNIVPVPPLLTPVLPSVRRLKKIVIERLMSHQPLSGDIHNPDYSFPSEPSSD